MPTRRTTLALMAATVLSPIAFARAAQAQDAELVQEMALGAEDAPVTVIEYASFTCPHCARFHETVFPPLKENYIDTGKVRFISREVYFDRFGLWAGMMARCGGGDRYFGIVDMLYKRQASWSRAGDPASVVGEMRKIGLTAGLTNEDLDACFQDQAKAEALVAEYQKNASADNVEATPTLIINGTKHSNMGYGALAAIIDQELGS
ncbi:MAG: DsbA family protein [Pseudomonadota bacterium]